MQFNVHSIKPQLKQIFQLWDDSIHVHSIKPQLKPQLKQIFQLWDDSIHVHSIKPQLKQIFQLWDDLILWLCNSTSIQLNLQAKDIILGYLLKTDYFLPVNVILLITKSYIFSCAISKSPLNLSHLKKKLHSLYNYEFLIHKEKYKEEVFEKNWNKLLNIFE